MSGVAMLTVLYGSLVVMTWLLLTIIATLPSALRPSATTSVALVAGSLAAAGCVEGWAWAKLTAVVPPATSIAPSTAWANFFRAVLFEVRLIRGPFGVRCSVFAELAGSTHLPTLVGRGLVRRRSRDEVVVLLGFLSRSRR